MRLIDRMQTIEAEDGKQPASTADPQLPGDPLADFKDEARKALYAKLDEQRLDGVVNDLELRRAVAAELGRFMSEGHAPLSQSERERVISEVSEDILGHGPIERMLADETITEIMVSSTEPIYVERSGRIERTAVHFRTEDHLRQVIDRIVSRVGRRVDEASPMVDARLPDGSRVNAIIPPLAVDGPALTIRKFSKDPYQIEHLIEFGTLSVGMASLLKLCVEGRLNVLITGGTGTGKTTLLNVVSGFIPTDQRIVTIEDSVELQLHQDHVIRLEARPSNVEGRGEVTIRDLVRNALRMRPDRIVVGEVRGAEALDMLQAMNTGHEGSLSTLHANTPRDALNRLETMIMMAGMEIPIQAIRDYIASSLDLIVHLTRLGDGSRRITKVTEVVGMEGEVITTQDIFEFRRQGTDENGAILGAALPTGIRPKFADRLASVGLPVPGEILGMPEERGSR
jgi:pilus assembly protein CpaF